MKIVTLALAASVALVMSAGLAAAQPAEPMHHHHHMMHHRMMHHRMMHHRMMHHHHHMDR